MEKRIKILGLALTLGLSLTLCPVKGLQGRDDFDDTENLTSINPKTSQLQQTGPINSEQKITKSLQFKNSRQRILSYLFEGKKSFEEGVRLNNQKDFSGAADKFRKALIYLEKTDSVQSIALTHLNLAICLQTLLQKEESLIHYNAALDISRKNGFKEYEAKALQGRGLILNSMNEKDEAIICLEKALGIHRGLFDISGEAIDWLIKGIIERNRNPDRARSYFECALRISQEIGDPALEQKSYHCLEQLREYLFLKQSRGEEDSSFTL